MAESLEDFLGINKKSKSIHASGSLSCQECDEIVSEGYIDEETMILTYQCSRGHDSRVKL
jgi:hypothetical protein